MTRQHRRIGSVQLAPLCAVIGAGLLSGCGLEKVILPPIYDTLETIADTLEPPPPPPPRSYSRSTAVSPAPRRPQSRAQSAVAQDGDRCHNVQSCETLLRKMTEGGDRSWISRAETPEALLTGVRMFALRTLRPKLTCPELGIALEQLRGVPAALRPPPSGSSPEDVARTTRLAAEVHDELRAENEARCKAAAAPPPPAAPPPVSAPPAPSPTQRPAAPGQPTPGAAQPPAPSRPSITVQPPSQPPAPGQPSVTTQPPGQPSITVQPPAQPPPAAPAQPQVTIPDQPERKQ